MTEKPVSPQHNDKPNYEYKIFAYMLPLHAAADII